MPLDPTGEYTFQELPSYARSEHGRRFIAVCTVAALGTVAIIRLLPQILAGLFRWPDFSWLASPQWPALFIALFLNAVMPALLPRTLRASALVVAVSRTTLIATTVLFLALLLKSRRIVARERPRYDRRMAPTRSCWNAMLALALGLLALAPAGAQAPLTSDLALWTNAAYPALRTATTACDDLGVCAAFWPISLDGDLQRQIDLLGAVVSPSGATAPASVRSGGEIGQPIAVGMQSGFAVFYDEIEIPTGIISATVLQFLGEDLLPTRPPILLPALGARGATYAGMSSVVRTLDGFALLELSSSREGVDVSVAFLDMDGRLLFTRQLSSPGAISASALAVQPGGNLVAVYFSQTALRRSVCSQVFVRRIASSGRLLGPAVAVADTACYQDSPAIGVATDGTFLIAWRSTPLNSPAAIVAERFSAQARPLGKLFRVSQSVAMPAVSVDRNSHYFVVWQGPDPNGAVSDIKGRWLKADGTPITSELTLSEAQADLDQVEPQVTVASSGLAIVTWQIHLPPNIYPFASVARVFTTPP